jgi:hypothetical protein
MLGVGLDIRLAEESVIKIYLLNYIVSEHIKQILRSAATRTL